MKRVQKTPEAAPVDYGAITTFEGPGVYVVRKIPTLFTRDWEGSREVTREVTPGCEWVVDGEGIATEKIDGTPILIKDGALYKRYDAKPERTPPEGFFPTDTIDEVTGRSLGWVPVRDDDPADKWVLQAFAYEQSNGSFTDQEPGDGTYELVGPKVQGNPHRLAVHRLLPHGEIELSGIPRDYDGLKECLATMNIEGIVWHRGNGDMAKVKSRDFGLKWPQ
jgi:hypothetical protein